MIHFRPVTTRKFLTGQLIWFGIWVFVTAAAIYLTPKPEGHGTHTELGLPPCPCVLLFGRPCPGCGLTTSFTATVHGHLLEAFRAHPFGPFLYLMLTVSALACLYGWVKKRHMDLSSRSFSRALGAFTMLFFAFGVARFAFSGHYADHDLYRQAMLMAKSR